MPKRKTNKADPFDVWGIPPRGMLHGMSNHQIAQLKSYISKVTGKAYTLAYDLSYDNGIVHAYTTVSLFAVNKLKEERDRMYKKTHRPNT